MPRPATGSKPELPPSFGKQVCAWIAANLVHAEGDYLGEPFALEPWQQRIIWRLYACDPQTLRRLVRRALIVRPKGCGKTELAAAIGLAELAGPVAFGTDGRSGRPKAPNIPVAAASFERQGNALTIKLANAKKKLEQGKITPAKGKLQDSSTRSTI